MKSKALAGKYGFPASPVPAIMCQKTLRRPDAVSFRKLLAFTALALGLLRGPSLSAQDQVQVRGFFANFSASYDRAFYGGASAIFFTPYDMAFTRSEYWFIHPSLLIQIPLASSVFDIYMTLGITAYPFKDILSIGASAGISLSNIVLDHFAYTGSLNAGVDIPVFKNDSRHYLSLGSGLRHRGAVRLFDYMDISDGYFRILNTFFFEIAYRIKM